MDIYGKIAVVRYAILPKQVLAFDEAYQKDSYDYKQYFLAHSSLESFEKFRKWLTSGEVMNVEYLEASHILLSWLKEIPFLDFGCMDMNPFDDFEESELFSFLNGEHIPDKLDTDEIDEFMFSWRDLSAYVKWFNELENKALPSLLELYISLIDSLKV